MLALVSLADFDRVDPVEAGSAELPGRQRRRLDQAFQRYEAQGVGADRVTDRRYRQAAGDQLGPAGEVDAEEAGPGDRRTGDPDVHPRRSGLAQHGHDRLLGVAADDGVVHHDHALAGDHVAERIQLEPDATLPDGLAGLDEGPADIAVLDQALAIRDAAALGVSDRRWGARLGHRDHQVGIDRMLSRQPTADGHPGGMHAATADRGIWPGQVDVLEQAAARLRAGEGARTHAALVDRDQLARGDFPDHRRPDDVQGRSLAGDHPAARQPAQHQRPEALRVTGGVQSPLVHEYQRERAAPPDRKS